MEEEICLPLLMFRFSEGPFVLWEPGKWVAVAYLLGPPSVLYTHPASQPSLAYSQAS